MSSTLRTAQIRLKDQDGTYQSAVDILSSDPAIQQIIQQINKILSPVNVNELTDQLEQILSSLDNHTDSITKLEENYCDPTIMNYVDEICKKIRKRQASSTLTFINIYNLRYEKQNTTRKQALNHMKNTIIEIANQLHVDFYCCYGNLASDILSSDTTKSEMIEATKLLNQAFKNNLQFRLIGSKDVLKNGNKPAFTYSELNSIIGNYNDKIVCSNHSINELPKIGYYDFQRQKLRIIILDTSWYDKDNQTSPYVTVNGSAIISKVITPEMKQMIQMMNIKDTRNITIEEAKEWKILFLSCLSLDKKTSDANYNSYMYNFFYNFKEGNSYSSIISEDDSDFIGDNASKIIGFIHGDSDFTYDNLKGSQRENNVLVDKIIFPYINIGVTGILNTDNIDFDIDNTNLVFPEPPIVIITLDVDKKIMYYYILGVNEEKIIHYQPIEFTDSTYLLQASFDSDSYTWSVNRLESSEGIEDCGAGQITIVPDTNNKSVTVAGEGNGYFIVQVASEDGSVEIWNMHYNHSENEQPQEQT